MKRICSWCQLVMSEGTLPATHGICPDCFQKMMGGLDHIPSDNGRFTMVIGRR